MGVDGRLPSGLEQPEGTTPAFSPDGRRVAYGGLFDGEGLHVAAVETLWRGRRLTRPSGVYTDWFPSWAPDANRLAFERTCWGPDWQPLPFGSFTG